jgi:hypothetical protein
VNPGVRVSQAAVEVFRTNTSGLRLSQLSAEVMRTNSIGSRTSQIAAEVLRQNSTGARTSQVAVEVMRKCVLGARASQVAVEVLREATYPAYVTQAVAEVIRTGDGLARVSQAVAETLRTGDGLARVTALVAEVLRTNAPAGQHSATAVRPWPFRANAQYDLTERYGYLSEVLRARNGSEQRRLLRETAGGMVSFTCTILALRDLQYAAVLLRSLMGGPIGAPLWQYMQMLTTGCSPGAVSIPVDTTTVPFYPGGMAMLWQSPWAWEIVEIAAVGAGSIEPAAPVEGAWPPRTTAIMPVVVGYMDEREELKRLGLQAGDFEFAFAVPAFFPLAGDDPAPGTQYLGFDVLELKPNRPGPVADGVSRAHQVLDTQTGEIWTDLLESAPVGDRPFNWICSDRAEALAQRRWLDARKGLVVPCWVPTWEPDLALAADGVEAATQITIQRVEYSGLVWAGSNTRRHLAVYARGAAPSYHYVSAAVDSGGDTETLTIEPALPVGWPAATTRISFLRFCRLREGFVDRKWAGGHCCDAQIPHVEIPKETPPAEGEV